MSEAERQPSEELANLLTTLQGKGVRIWSAEGALRYAAPRGMLTSADVGLLRKHRDEVKSLVQKTSKDPGGFRNIAPRRTEDSLGLPLAHTQLAHWNLLELNRKPSMRQIACAIRISGPLDVGVLQRSLDRLACRHEALRTVFSQGEHGLRQSFAEPKAIELLHENLARVSHTDRHCSLLRFIERLILDPVDPRTGNMFAVGLARLGLHEGILIIAIDHLIADMFSLNFITTELFKLYESMAHDDGENLPPVERQYSDYVRARAAELKNPVPACRSEELRRLLDCERLVFPSDPSLPDTRDSGWDIVPFAIDRETISALTNFSRRIKTTAVLSAFAAYAACVLRWCGRSEGIVRYQIDGRYETAWRCTVGYLSFPLYLDIRLREGDAFTDLVSNVVDEYCRAYESADFGHIESLDPRPEVARGPVFNWVSRGTKDRCMELKSPKGRLLCSPVPFESPILKAIDIDHEPMLVLYEGDGRAEGRMTFPRSRFTSKYMERFVSKFLISLKAMLCDPRRRVLDA